MRLSICLILVVLLSIANADILTSWIKSTGNNVEYNIQADVIAIHHDDDFVYITSNSFPKYKVGPWQDNPNMIIGQNVTHRFRKHPKPETYKHVRHALGEIGLLTNGVAIYNGWDGFSYMDKGYWLRNAFVFEGISFDSCNGHPDPRGFYHVHLIPSCLYDPHDHTKHSPIIGYMFDSYPVYGSFGYSDPNDPKSPIKRIMSGFRTRSINKRMSYVNGTILNSVYHGPVVNSEFPLGSFLEDYEHVSGSGDLDEYNGRWCKTPEYPEGTYAYFMTTDTDGNPAYPFIIGQEYYGKVDNVQPVQVPPNAVKYF